MLCPMAMVTAVPTPPPEVGVKNGTWTGPVVPAEVVTRLTVTAAAAVTGLP